VAAQDVDDRRGRTESRERVRYRDEVLVRGTDENVEVLRETGFGVVADGPSAHDEVLSVCGGQRRKQIPEVGVEVRASR